MNLWNGKCRREKIHTDEVRGEISEKGKFITKYVSPENHT